MSAADNIKIIRAKHDASTRWFITARTSAQDNHLSFRTRGILWYLLSKPDDWEIRIEDIQKEGKIGRDAAKKSLNELETCGYLSKRTRYRDEKQRWNWTPYILHETPSTENPSMDPSTEIPSTENQETVHQSMENPSIYKEQKTENKTQRTEKEKTENQSSSILVDSASADDTASDTTPQKDDDDLNSNSPDQKVSQEQIDKHMPSKPKEPEAPPPLPSDQPDTPLHKVLSIWKTVKATTNVAEDVDDIYDDTSEYGAPIVIKMLKHIETTKGNQKVFTWNYVRKALQEAYPKHTPAASADFSDIDGQIERLAVENAKVRAARNVEYLKYANNDPDTSLSKASGE